MTGVLLTFLCLICALAPPRLLHAQEQRRALAIAGAQSLVPLAERFSVEFRKQHPALEIQIRGGGSNFAVEAVRGGKIDIGLVARILTGAEQAELYTQLLGQDAIILLSYPGNPAPSLTLQQIRGIYRGEITNWREVGGEHKGIIALTREPGSALRTIFMERIFGNGFDGQEKAFTIRASKEKILRTIKRVAGSLGYGIVRLDEAEQQGVMVLRVEGKLPTADNIRDGIYPVIRPRLAIARRKPPTVVREWTAGFARFVNRASGQENRR